MSDQGLRLAQEKMTAAGVHRTAVEVFGHYYRQLEQGVTGLIPEDTIDPLTDPPRLEDVTVPDDVARDALAQTVLINLNGGLGTSMGMDRAKSLLPVRDGKSFLDLLAEQVLAARAAYDIRMPLLLMNSFNTQEDSLASLDKYPDLRVDGLPLDFLQTQEPKIRTDDLTPVSWPDNPHLEWCPPGHGDLYVSLQATGVLEALLDRGFRYASVSNADNLGAGPNPRLAGWFASSGAPYAAEVCPRTLMDRKGGHLAIRKADKRLILRDTAQTSPEEMHYFTDEHRHPFFHTNNLWFDLLRLYETLLERDSVLGLPLIRNVKTVDPRDADSPKVYQIETAMGAAVEVFEGAAAICVPRSRFLPVKTTNELLLVRSDVYEVGEDAGLRALVDPTPVISLDEAVYRKIDAFEARLPHGAPSLRQATSLTVRGDFTFEAGVRVIGDVTLDTDEPQTIAAGTELS